MITEMLFTFSQLQKVTMDFISFNFAVTFLGTY